MIAADDIVEVGTPPTGASDEAFTEPRTGSISDIGPENLLVDLSLDRHLPTQEWHLPRVRLSDYYV